MCEWNDQFLEQLPINFLQKCLLLNFCRQLNTKQNNQKGRAQSVDEWKEIEIVL